jgi:ribosome biogenesis GTPase A
MNEFRSGSLGRITLETPEEFGRWLAAGQMLDAQRQAKKEARARGKKGAPGREEAPPDAA